VLSTFKYRQPQQGQFLAVTLALVIAVCLLAMAGSASAQDPTKTPTWRAAVKVQSSCFARARKLKGTCTGSTFTESSRDSSRMFFTGYYRVLKNTGYIEESWGNGVVGVKARTKVRGYYHVTSRYTDPG
jgi:hypothetical protein